MKEVLHQYCSKLYLKAENEESTCAVGMLTRGRAFREVRKFTSGGCRDCSKMMCWYPSFTSSATGFLVPAAAAGLAWQPLIATASSD